MPTVNPSTETTLSKVQTCPTGLVAKVKQGVEPKVEPRVKSSNNQRSSKRKPPSKRQNKKTLKRPSKVQGRVPFVLI